MVVGNERIIIINYYYYYLFPPSCRFANYSGGGQIGTGDKYFDIKLVRVPSSPGPVVAEVEHNGGLAFTTSLWQLGTVCTAYYDFSIGAKSQTNLL